MIIISAYAHDRNRAQIMQQVLFHRALNIFNEFILSKLFYFFLNKIERNIKV